MFELPKLPYEMDALAPYIDAETLGIHYGKHHQAYLNNLNNFLTEENLKFATVEEVVRKGNELSKRIKNNAGGVWNHAFYWDCFGTENHAPAHEMLTLIESNFGSFNTFQEELSKSAMSVFGSGWAWLIQRENGKLEIVTTANQDHPWQDDQNCKPLLVCDVWEHAYYLQYRNVRADYVKNFWEIIDWEKVEDHLIHGYAL